MAEQLSALLANNAVEFRYGVASEEHLGTLKRTDHTDQSRGTLIKSVQSSPGSGTSGQPLCSPGISNSHITSSSNVHRVQAIAGNVLQDDATSTTFSNCVEVMLITVKDMLFDSGFLDG